MQISFEAGSLCRYIVTEDDAGERLDVFLHRQLTSYSRAHIQRLIKEGVIVAVTGSRVKPAWRVSVGEEYHLLDLHLKQKSRRAFASPLDIRYQDEFLLVIYKPAGLVVHPGIGNKDRTLVNILVHHYTKEELSNSHSMRPGIVHRLDKETEGFLIVAKTDFAHARLCEMIKDRMIQRKYLALTHSAPKSQSGQVEALIKRSQKKMMIGKHTGKTAITHYRIFACTLDRKYSLVECTLETGRTHQIRVHMKSLGCPIVGDKLYGLKKEIDLCTEHHGLWANSLRFVHPFTGKEMLFYTEPADIAIPFIEKLSSKTSQKQ